jgi:predicted small lipoprotein YifL
MKPSIRSVLIAALLALALAACGGSSAPAAAPTAAPAAQSESGTSSAPTADTEAKPRPTAAAEPTAAPEPTAAAEPTAASQSGAGVSLADAIAKAKGVKTYRLEMNMFSKGLLDAMASAGGSNADTGSAGADIPLMNMTGEFDNANSHFTLKGLFAGFLGVDPEKGLEVLSVDGKSYIHGPVPMLGATDAAWYASDENQSSVSKPPMDSSQFLSAFAGENTDLSKFKLAGSESIDGRSCDIYAGDKEATLAAFQAANAGSNPGDLGEIKDAEFKFWVCDDSYVHQVQLSLTGTSKEKPDQTVDFKMHFHMYDFDSTDIKIEAPADAQPLKAPSIDLPTEQP